LRFIANISTASTLSWSFLIRSGGIWDTMPGWTLPFRISIDFAFLKNILSAIVFSLICVP
jgi:hypothetical protein